MLQRYSDKLKSISYYVFFGLMMFAKGIGLDSGDKLYYVLSIAAGICIMVKILLTRYTKRQMLAALFLVVFSLVVYRNSGRLGIVLSVLAIVGIKDMNIRRLFQTGAVIFSISFIGTVIFAMLGIIDNPLVVHDKSGIGEVIRWGMGYSTGNVFHESYFILSALLCYSWGKKYDIKRCTCLMVGNIVVFFFSLSYTGILVTSFYLILAWYGVKRKSLSKVESVLCQLFCPLCLIFSFCTPFLLSFPIVARLDAMLQARLSFSVYYLQNQRISLLGSRMESIPNFWVIMDNSYVFILMTFGVITMLLFVVGYVMLIKRLVQEKRLVELALVFGFLLYGIMEQFLSNAFMNVSLLLLGEVLWGKSILNPDIVSSSQRVPVAKVEDGDLLATKRVLWRGTVAEGVAKNRRVICGVAAITAAGALLLYLLMASKAENIEVSLDALNYVDTQSVQIRVDNQECEKSQLKDLLSQYHKLLCDELMIQKVLDNLKLDNRLTAEQVISALEVSIPQNIYIGKSFDIFRIRMLQLYSDVSEEEYKQLLAMMIEKVQEQDEESYMVIEPVGNERVGKSFGEDRIEHIGDYEKYRVEKTGNIVRVEYVRGAVSSLLLGGMLGGVLALIYVAGGILICMRKRL